MRLDQLTRREWWLGAAVAYALLDAYIDAHFRTSSRVRIRPGAAGGEPSARVRLATGGAFDRSSPVHIRNFCIVAHIDPASNARGPPAEITHTLTPTNEGAVLDDMDLEREKGITSSRTRSRWSTRPRTAGSTTEPDRHPRPVDSPTRCRAASRPASAILVWTPRRGRSADALELFPRQDQSSRSGSDHKVDLPGRGRTTLRSRSSRTGVPAGTSAASAPRPVSASPSCSSG